MNFEKRGVHSSIESHFSIFVVINVANWTSIEQFSILYLQMSTSFERIRSTSLISDQRATMPVELGQAVINHRELCVVLNRNRLFTLHMFCRIPKIPWEGVAAFFLLFLKNIFIHITFEHNFVVLR